MLLLLICVGHGMFETTQDERNVVRQAAFLLGLLGYSIWIIRGTNCPGRVRWGLGLAPWLLIAVWISQFEMINNGDMEIVGWRWRWMKKADQRLEVPGQAGNANDLAETPNDYPGFLG